MANHPDAGVAVANLTSFVLADREAFIAATSDLPGEANEALALLGRASQAVVQMYAEERKLSVEDALDEIALRIVNG